MLGPLVPVEDVQIGPADRRRVHPDEHLAVAPARGTGISTSSAPGARAVLRSARIVAVTVSVPATAPVAHPREPRAAPRRRTVPTPSRRIRHEARSNRCPARPRSPSWRSRAPTAPRPEPRGPRRQGSNTPRPPTASSSRSSTEGGFAAPDVHAARDPDVRPVRGRHAHHAGCADRDLSRSGVAPDADAADRRGRRAGDPRRPRSTRASSTTATRPTSGSIGDRGRRRRRGSRSRRRRRPTRSTVYALGGSTASAPRAWRRRSVDARADASRTSSTQLADLDAGCRPARSVATTPYEAARPRAAT